MKMKTAHSKKRIAASTVICRGKTFTNYVVEFTDGKVSGMYPLVEELPFTEWHKELIIRD